MALASNAPARAMDELPLLQRWFRYNAEIRGRYLRTFEQVPSKVLLRDEGASYPLLQIYLHVLDAYRLWTDYVPNDRVRLFPASLLRRRVRSLARARQASRKVAQEVRGFVENLSPADLDTEIVYEAPVGANWTRWRTDRVRLRAVLWHLVEEELQHRGEMNALLWRHGAEPPIVSFHQWRDRAGDPASREAR